MKSVKKTPSPKIFTILNQSNISIDRQGRIWCAYKGGVIIFNKNDNYDIIKFPYTNSDETILALGQVGDGMWVSTQSNVWSIDTEF